MDDFFRKSYRLLRDRAEEISQASFHLVFDLLNNRLPLLRSKISTDLRNLETVFSLIEMGQLIGRIPGTEPSQLEQYGHAIRRVLVETIESYCLFPIDAEGHWVPHETYGKLAAALAPIPAWQRGEIAFITFNYDIALDFALHYHGFALDYALDRSAPKSGATPLLKLHGSLNWGLCSKCSEVRTLQFPAILGSQGLAGLKFANTKHPLRLGTHLGQLSNHCEGSVASPDPAIVPPSWSKAQHQRLFQRVWNRAAEEISEAEVIIIVGYSFPQTDGFFRDLFSLSLFGPAQIDRILFVTPQTQVAGRFREMLGPETQDRFVHNGNLFEQAIDDVIRLATGG